MKVIFVVPSFSIIGGIANHYLGLNDYWRIRFRYSVEGRRRRIPAMLCLLPDYIAFIAKLIVFRPDIVVVNPSLGRYMLVRDGIYLLLAKLFGRKTICFFHGWRKGCANAIAANPNLFNKIYGKANLTYVLYSGFEKQLRSWGFKGKVKLNTTKVDDKLLSGFDMATRQRKPSRLLFLARVVREKGIFTVLDTFGLLKARHPELTLAIVGDGADLPEAKAYAKAHEIPDITFTGGLRGNDIARQYADSDLYILPTHSEGMATTVLEAMAFGLPVVTRPVGGVVDFFEQGRMGYLVESLEPEAYAARIEEIIDNTALYRTMAETNYEYAQSHFYASQVAKRMETDFSTLL